MYHSHSHSNPGAAATRPRRKHILPMNGVRRLLGGATQRSQSPPTSIPVSTEPPPQPPFQTTAPLALSSKPSWPPTSTTATTNGYPNGRPDSASSSTTNTSAAYVNGGLSKSFVSRQNSLENDSRPQSLGSSMSSPPQKPVPVSSPGSSPTSALRSPNALAGPSSPSKPVPSRVAQLRAWKRASGTVDTRDELLMSLLASEAIVESREFDILNSEDVEELKKEYQVLEARQGAMEKKLKLETKIRDAASSLAKVNAAHKTVSKQSSEQLETANRKVESVQKDLWRISERSNEINRKLLEHRAGVLSFSLRNLEAKVAGDTDESGYSTLIRNSQMSPTSSETSYSSCKTKFEGPHLFSGHENALQPLSPRKPPSAAEYAFLEGKVKDVTGKLQAATDAQNNARREASMLKLELEGLETSLALELQAAEEKMSSMRFEVEKVGTLESQLREMAEGQKEWDREQEIKQREIETLERRLEVMEEKSSEAVGIEIRVLELESALGALQNLMRNHGLNLPNNVSLSQQVSYLETHLDDVRSRLDAQQTQRNEWESIRHKLEEEVRVGLDKREALVQEVEEARQDREEARKEARILEGRLREQAMTPAESMKSISYSDAPQDIKDFIELLKPVWNALPSPESRASKFGRRTKSPISAPGSPNMSLSELDVRLLKTLYDGRPAYQIVDTSYQFSVEALAARVQALIADDRALIERLVRFAQAHDLLRKNAERAQKLAQESSVALETYQKQVKVLEDRNMVLGSNVTALQNEIQELQGAIDKVLIEKRDVEMQAAEQAETCRQLSEANDTLSAKTLSLAEEAAAAPEAIRNQLERQLSECKAELERAQEDITAMRTAEASQSIALLDELNHMQGENANLRAQLRAGKK
ncbi:Up-regulated during septation-domain-containing protein [Phellopilus nigrolimitatus]|nr:Up-regulated during septation-domain-containing protein [Phellopilus nigrolimitatus]